MIILDRLPFPEARFPRAYWEAKTGVNIMGRISEYEPICRLFNIFLVDPLAKWTPKIYEDLIKTTDLNHQVYVMMPSMHGHILDTDKAVLDMCRKYNQVVGLITKHPKELSEYLDSAQ